MKEKITKHKNLIIVGAVGIGAVLLLSRGGDDAAGGGGGGGIPLLPQLPLPEAVAGAVTNVYETIYKFPEQAAPMFVGAPEPTRDTFQESKKAQAAVDKEPARATATRTTPPGTGLFETLSRSRFLHPVSAGAYVPRAQAVRTTPSGTGLFATIARHAASQTTPGWKQIGAKKPTGPGQPD